MSRNIKKNDRSVAAQQGLFDTGLSEGAMDVSLGFKQCLSRAIAACGKDRYQIAAEISRITQRDTTKDMLDKYTSSDPAYRMPAELLPAFCHVTRMLDPFHYLLEPLQAEVVTADDMKFLKLARLEEQRRQLEEQIRVVRAQCGIK